MRFRRSTTFSALAVLALLVVSAAPLRVARADDDHNNRRLEAVPFTFVGLAAGCGGPAGSRIVTSAWLNGFGLPDNGGPNAPSTATANDPHSGLLLSKNGPSSDCSAAGVRITGAQGMKLTELGFDFRNGTHCGAGAPRFNVTTSDNVFHFLGGCANGTPTTAPQDPTQWTRIRIDPASAAQAFPPVAPGATIKSISIIYDEGTENAGVQDPMGVGLSNLDNIDINGTLITSGPSHGDRDDNDNAGGNGHQNGDGGNDRPERGDR